MKTYATKPTIAHFRGCLLGGAIGDALGAAIEFSSLTRIRSIYGAPGLTDYAPAYGRLGAVTDDTQMTLFTAEGLILSKVRPEYDQGINVVPAVYHALLRWLSTQDTDRRDRLIRDFGACAIVDGVLTAHHSLFDRRAPGNTCLGALRSGIMGTTVNPLNTSKGCGGVMRMAPVGLFYPDPQQAFRIGCDCAALTHGHPTGYLTAGALAAIIAMILAGNDLLQSIDTALQILKTWEHHEETVQAIERAVAMSDQTTPTPETIESIGAGWIAEEALAISLYCALTASTDFRQAVLLAVNHSGDSDSTGAITGNLVGALNGIDAIPAKWLSDIEMKELIEEIAADLFEQTDFNHLADD